MKKALHGPERKTFRNKYLAVLVMALSFCLGAFAQTDSTKYSKIKGYGFIYKRMGTDSIQLIPLSTSPHVPYRHGAIRYNPTDSTLEYWTATQWIKAATGGAVAVDTFYAANDSTLILESGGNVFGAVVGTSRLDSLHIYTAADPDPDTLYSYKNGDSTLVGLLAKTEVLANQGLSKNGDTVQLGQIEGNVSNPAILLNPRQIPLNGNNIRFSGDSGNVIIGDTTPDLHWSRVPRFQINDDDTTHTLALIGKLPTDATQGSFPDFRSQLVLSLIDTVRHNQNLQYLKSSALTAIHDTYYPVRTKDRLGATRYPIQSYKRLYATDTLDWQEGNPGGDLVGSITGDLELRQFPGYTGRTVYISDSSFGSSPHIFNATTGFTSTFRMANNGSGAKIYAKGWYGMYNGQLLMGTADTVENLVGFNSGAWSGGSGFYVKRYYNFASPWQGSSAYGTYHAFWDAAHPAVPAPNRYNWLGHKTGIGPGREFAAYMLDIDGSVAIEKDSIPIITAIGSNYLLTIDTSANPGDSNRLKRILPSDLGISGSGSSAYGIDSTVIGGTPGSVLFVGSDGSLQESNAAFSYDSTNSGLTITKTLGVTQNTSSGFRSFNTTAATSGNQQMPPDFVLGGQGFATTPAASQPVVMTMGLLPVQGSTNPSSTWRLRSSVNGGSFTNILQVTSAGDVTTGSTLTTGSSIISGGYVAIASGSVLRWSSRSNIGSPVDGNLTIYNSPQNDFGRLQFGGTTSSFPSIKRSTTNLQVRLADDSDFGGWETGALTTNSTVTLNNNPTGLATDLLLVKGADSVVKTIASSTFTTPVQVGGQISDSLAALPNNIQSINSQTQSTQTIAVGNGMNVTSGSGTHTISILTTFITSGRYTPTLTGVTNVAGTTTHECTYFRVGNAVTVSGIIEIDPTSSATLTELRVQLPITSGVDFATIYECSGAGNAISTQGSSGGFTADTTNEEAFFSFVTATDANQSISFSFTYFITPL